MDSQPKLKWTHDSWNTSIIRNTESCMNVKYFRGFIDNDIWSHPCPQEKQLHQLVVVTCPPLWSTSPPPRSLKTPGCPHNYSCLCLCHLVSTKMIAKVIMIFSPKKRTLLLRVTTRTPCIGLGRAPPGTSLHTPSEGRYTSVEAIRGSMPPLPPVTSNTLNNQTMVVLIYV